MSNLQSEVRLVQIPMVQMSSQMSVHDPLQRLGLFPSLLRKSHRVSDRRNVEWLPRVQLHEQPRLTTAVRSFGISRFLDSAHLRIGSVHTLLML